VNAAAADLAFARFESGGRQEWLIRIGAEDAPAILFVPPLFEEMNRTRALLAGVMRRLAAQGFGCWLPDLSGTGESERELSGVAWSDWRHDVTSASSYVTGKAGEPLVASLRGGVLLDDGAATRGWWRFAPADGLALQRDMVRAGLAGVEWAGYAPSDALKAGLAGATQQEVAPLRTVRLDTDAQPADLKLDGPALWRRSEPGMSDDLADALAADLAAWSRQCAG
jgi:alpha-beta hydrolase superfamily lysophospholipase